MTSPLTGSFQFNVAQSHIQPSNTPINTDLFHQGHVASATQGQASPSSSSIASSNSSPPSNFGTSGGHHQAQNPAWMSQPAPSSPSPAPLLQPPQATQHGSPMAQQIITPDLRNGVVRQFGLSPTSQQLLAGMEQMSQSMVVYNPELAALPRYLFYVLGAVLRLNDVMTAHLAVMPAAHETRSLYERVLAILDQGDSFVVKESHTRIIRAAANNIMFSKDHMEMDTTTRKVMAYLQANNSQLNLSEAFSTPVNQAALNRAVKRTVSSVVSAFRADLVKSIEGNKGTSPQSLIQFTRMAHVKYTTGATEQVRIEKGHILRFVLFRAFLLQRSELMKDAKKRARPSSDSEDNQEPARIRTLTNFEGAVVPEPDMPANTHFFALLEWWLDCRRIEYGSDMNTTAWRSYIRRLLAVDTTRFPHPASEPSIAASSALHGALLWSGAITRDENIDPSAQTAQVAPTAAALDFSSLVVPQ